LIGIRGLAQHLDISIGTVSRALNGKADVNPETRRRVLEAAAELGYSPNQSGRSLRHGTTNLVGVVIPTNRQKSLIDPTFAEALDGVRQQLVGTDLDLAIFLCANDADAFAHLRRIAERRLADALIIADTLPTDRRVDYLINKAIPFVAFGRSRSGGPHQWVDIDFSSAVRQSVARLAGQSHRRIGLVLTSQDTNFIRLIREAYRRECKARGLDTRNEWVQRIGHGADAGYLGAQALMALPDRPTAVVVQNDEVAVGVYRCFSELRIRPGRDVAIIALEDGGRAAFMSPTLSAYRVDLGIVGAQLGQALLAALGRGPRNQEPIQALVPMTPHPGDSEGWESK
jgi:DNA-binding LacI/PurR family transcriptional regulator